MSEFDSELPAFRLIETHHGDDLPAVAHRELGDANRWPELVWLNGLSYPYLTDDPDAVRPGVILNGSMIRVPSPAGMTVDKSSVEDVYETDIKLTDRRLQASADGDFEIVSGVGNLTQQLSHAIQTPRGELRRHPGYGCLVWRLLGTVNGPTAGFLGSEYVKSTLQADYRVSRVTYSQAEVQGDTLRITAQAEASSGGSVNLSIGN